MTGLAQIPPENFRDEDGRHRDQIVTQFIHDAEALYEQLDDPTQQRLLVSIVEGFRDRNKLQMVQIDSLSALLMNALHQRDQALEERDELLRLMRELEDYQERGK